MGNSPMEAALNAGVTIDPADLDKHDHSVAETEKFMAERDQAHWQGLYNEQSYLVRRHEAELAQRQRDWRMASDIEARTYRLCGEIDHEVTHSCAEYLSCWQRLAPGEPVTIKLTTPGGDAWAGMALVDEIRAMREEGLDLTIKVRGTAASMGAILLQAASPGKRIMGPGSTMLLHKVQFGAGGSLDAIKDITAWVEIMQEQVYDLIAARCGETDAPKKLTRTQLKKLMDRTDRGIGPVEALELGLIDGIG